MAIHQPNGRGPVRFGATSSPVRRVRALTQAQLFHARENRRAKLA